MFIEVTYGKSITSFKTYFYRTNLNLRSKLGQVRKSLYKIINDDINVKVFIKRTENRFKGLEPGTERMGIDVRKEID